MVGTARHDFMYDRDSTYVPGCVCSVCIKRMHVRVVQVQRGCGNNVVLSSAFRGTFLAQTHTKNTWAASGHRTQTVLVVLVSSPLSR